MGSTGFSAGLSFSCFTMVLCMVLWMCWAYANTPPPARAISTMMTATTIAAIRLTRARRRSRSFLNRAGAASKEPRRREAASPSWYESSCSARMNRGSALSGVRRRSAGTLTPSAVRPLAPALAARLARRSSLCVLAHASPVETVLARTAPRAIRLPILPRVGLGGHTLASRGSHLRSKRGAVQVRRSRFANGAWTTRYPAYRRSVAATRDLGATSSPLSILAPRQRYAPTPMTAPLPTVTSFSSIAPRSIRALNPPARKPPCKPPPLARDAPPCRHPTP